jgi:RNA polymerase sigma-70 factor (ECF subfamily)
VRGATPRTDPDLAQQRKVVDAFFAASRNGDFEALLEVLDPDVVFRADRGRLGVAAPTIVTGAENVARQILERGSRFAPFGRPAIVNGNAGVVVAPAGKPVAVVGFTVTDGRIVEIDVIADPEKLGGLSL